MTCIHPGTINHTCHFSINIRPKNQCWLSSQRRLWDCSPTFASIIPLQPTSYAHVIHLFWLICCSPLSLPATFATQHTRWTRHTLWCDRDTTHVCQSKWRAQEKSISQVMKDGLLTALGQRWTCFNLPLGHCILGFMGPPHSRVKRLTGQKMWGPAVWLQMVRLCTPTCGRSLQSSWCVNPTDVNDRDADGSAPGLF